MESDSSVVLSDTSVGKLKELLKLESKSHRDTGDCYDTLQKEYDELLRKYAQAENTIDKLRIDTLREKIEKCKGNTDGLELFTHDNSVWKCLYDDLIHRTNKLQDAVTEFQAHLTNHEYTSDEVNDIFDSLHTDFENIANVFQSMQALGIKMSKDVKTSNDEEHPEESILVDDLEGNLYRLGLRLEEIQDEIGDTLRGDALQLDENSNYSVSPRMLHGTDSKRSYDGECSETETTKAENNIYSDDDDINGVDLHLRDWKPATEDLTQFMFYKKQYREQYLGLDPIYLSRCNSAPGQLNLQFDMDAMNAQHRFTRDLPKDNVDLRNMQENLDDNSIKKAKSRRSPTYAIETLHLNKSPTSEKSTLVHQSHPNVALTSTEDSGFLEGSHPSQQIFPSRNAISPLRTHYRIDEVDAVFETNKSLDQGDVVNEGAGEQYKERLDSLRSYIFAKRAANSSVSATEYSEKRSRKLSRGKKSGSHNYRYSLRSSDAGNDISKMNSGYKGTIDPGSSTAESILSCAIKPVLEEKEKKMFSRRLTKEEKPGIQKEDIDTLREEMCAVKEIVLDLKNSLASLYLSPPQDPIPTGRFYDSQHSRLVDNSARDERDLSPERSDELLAFPQVEEVQKKQFEMLEKLDNKLDDISKTLRPSSVNQRQSLSRGSAHVNIGRLDSPSRYSHCSSYYNQVGEENIAEVNGRPNADVYEIRNSPQQAHAPRNTENAKEVNLRCGSCDNFVSPRNNCTLAHGDDVAGGQTYPRSIGERVDTMILNQHRGSTPLNHRPENYDATNAHTPGHRAGGTFNDKFYCETFGDGTFNNKFYHETFGELGEKLNELSSHVKECKENEENRLREETLNQQKQLVEFLREKLEKLNTRIEEHEKKIPSDANATSVSPLPANPCPMCGRVDIHQHGRHIFNGHNIIEQVGNIGLGTSPTYPQSRMGVSPSNVDSRQSDNAYKIHNTPKKESEAQGRKSQSPIVYHHYHTVYSPPRQQQYDYSRQSTDTEVFLSNRMYDSLEKASLAAMHMETLSKKMLRGITVDLFNSGPNEF